MTIDHTLFCDSEPEIPLREDQAARLLDADVIQKISKFEPAHEHEVGYTVCDEYVADFGACTGPFAFLDTNTP